MLDRVKHFVATKIGDADDPSTLVLSDGSKFTGTFFDSDRKKPRKGTRVFLSGETHTGQFCERSGRLTQGVILSASRRYEGRFETHPTVFLAEGVAELKTEKMTLRGAFDPATKSLKFGVLHDEGKNTFNRGHFYRPPTGTLRVICGTINFDKPKSLVQRIEGLYDPADARVMLGRQHYKSGRAAFSRYTGGATVWASTCTKPTRDALLPESKVAYYVGLRRLAGISGLLVGRSVSLEPVPHKRRSRVVMFPGVEAADVAAVGNDDASFATSAPPSTATLATAEGADAAAASDSKSPPPKLPVTPGPDGDAPVATPLTPARPLHGSEAAAESGGDESPAASGTPVPQAATTTEPQTTGSETSGAVPLDSGVPLLPQYAFVIPEHQTRTPAEALAEFDDALAQFRRETVPEPEFTLGPLSLRVQGSDPVNYYYGVFARGNLMREGVKVINSAGVGRPGTESYNTGLFGRERIGLRVETSRLKPRVARLSSDGSLATGQMNFDFAEGVFTVLERNLVHGYHVSVDTVCEQRRGESRLGITIAPTANLAVERVGVCDTESWQTVCDARGCISSKPIAQRWYTADVLAKLAEANALHNKRDSPVNREALTDFVASVGQANLKLLELTDDENDAVERSFLRGDALCLLRRRGRPARKLAFTGTVDDELHGVFGTTPEDLEKTHDVFHWSGVASLTLSSGTVVHLYRVATRIVTELSNMLASRQHTEVSPPPSAAVAGGVPAPRFPTLPFLWTLIDLDTGAPAGCFGYDECWALERLLLDVEGQSATSKREEQTAEAAADGDEPAWKPSAAGLRVRRDPNSISWAVEKGACASGVFEVRLDDELTLYLLKTRDERVAGALDPSGRGVVKLSSNGPDGTVIRLFPHSVFIAGIDKAFELRRQPLTVAELTELPFYTAAFLKANADSGLHYGVPGVDDIEIAVAELDRVGEYEALEAIRSLAYIHGAVAFTSVGPKGTRRNNSRAPEDIEMPWMPEVVGAANADLAHLRSVMDENIKLRQDSVLADSVFDRVTLRWPFVAREHDVTARAVSSLRRGAGAEHHHDEDPGSDVEEVLHTAVAEDEEHTDGADADVGEFDWHQMTVTSFFFTEDDGGSHPSQAVAATDEHSTKSNAEASAAAQQESSAGGGGDGGVSASITVRFAAGSEQGLTAVLHDTLRWLLNAERIRTPTDWEARQPAVSHEGEESGAGDRAATADGTDPLVGSTTTALNAHSGTGDELGAAESDEARIRAIAKFHGINLPNPLPARLPTHDVLLHFVPAESTEFRAVQQCFAANAFNRGILCIQRVQNAQLWEKFVIQTRQISKENRGDANEVLWMKHGTRNTPPLAVCQNGFDHRYCEAGMYGRATYFAYTSHYSNLFRHDVPDSVFSDGGVAGQMILARVVRGRVDVMTAHKSDLKRPALGCHCVEGPVNASGNLAVMTYELNQAYPAYIVTYKVSKADASKHATPMSAVVAKKAASATSNGKTPAKKPSGQSPAPKKPTPAKKKK